MKNTKTTYNQLYKNFKRWSKTSLLNEYKTYQLNNDNSVQLVTDLKSIQNTNGSFVVFGGTMLYNPQVIDNFYEALHDDNFLDEIPEDLSLNQLQQLVLKEWGINSSPNEPVLEYEEIVFNKFKTGERKAIKVFKEFAAIQTWYNLISFVFNIYDQSGQFLLGNLLWKDKAILLNDLSEYNNEVSSYSNTIQSLLRQFKNAGFQYLQHDSYKEEEYIGSSQSKDRLPKYVYHGTTAKSLISILKRGFRPANITLDDKQNPSDPASVKANFNVFHTEHVFVTSEYDVAEWFAKHAAQNKKEQGVVVYLKLPDPRLLEPDFDAYASTSPNLTNTKGYSVPEFEKQIDPNHIYRQDAQAFSRATALSSHVGKWGYRGVIPASAILTVFVQEPDDTGLRFSKLAPQGLQAWLTSIKEVGGNEIGEILFGENIFAGDYDYEYHKESYFPENEDDEQW